MVQPPTSSSLIDDGQSCCGECWCIPSEDEACPIRTTAYPQLYTMGMVKNFANKTLLDPNSMEEVPGGNLFEVGCNPYDGVSVDTSPPWKAYNGCELNPTQLFSSTSADGYDSAVCAFSYQKFDEEDDCNTYTYKTYARTAKAEEDGAYVTHNTQCGACSNAIDLSVYMRFPDLTSAGVQCSVDTLLNFDGGVLCYEGLGFTNACATVWAHNSKFDGRFQTCLL